MMLSKKYPLKKVNGNIFRLISPLHQLPDPPEKPALKTRNPSEWSQQLQQGQRERLARNIDFRTQCCKMLAIHSEGCKRDHLVYNLGGLSL